MKHDGMKRPSGAEFKQIRKRFSDLTNGLQTLTRAEFRQWYAIACQNAGFANAKGQSVGFNTLKRMGWKPSGAKRSRAPLVRLRKPNGQLSLEITTHHDKSNGDYEHAANVMISGAEELLLCETAPRLLRVAATEVLKASRARLGD